VNPLGLVKRFVPDSAHKRSVAIKYAIGLAMLVAAIWMVAANHDAVDSAWDHARSAHPLVILAAVTLPVANVVAIAFSFWLLNKKYAEVSFRETFALIASAWLLNFLPMRPGMVGRIAYHKRYHGIDVRSSAAVLGINMILTGISVGILLLLVVGKVLLDRSGNWPGSGGAILNIAIEFERSHPWLIWLPTLSMPCIVLGVGAWLMHAAGTARWRLVATLASRYLDMLIWVGRYAVVFELVGRPLGIPEAVAVAVVSQMAQIIPLAGNGLGLREWSVGLTVGVLPSGVGSGRGPDPMGLAGDLVNRGAEFIAAAPVGLASLGWLALRGRVRLQTELAENGAQSLDDAPAPAKDTPSPPPAPPQAHPETPTPPPTPAPPRSGGDEQDPPQKPETSPERNRYP